MFRLHPLSALLGAAIVGLCILTMSQMRVAAAVIGVEYIPHPRDMVQIREGTPYTVPGGKLFVLTGLGQASGSAGGFGTWTDFQVNGVAAAGTYLFQSPGYISTVTEVPKGLSVPAGAVIDVTGGYVASNDAVAWGYLAAQ